MTRAVTLAEIADTNTFIVDGANSRVGINSSIPTTTLDVGGAVKATSFTGDGSGLTGAGIGTQGSVNTSGIITATSFVGSGANLTGVISGVELKQGGSSVGTSITAINFSGATVSAPVAGLSTVTIAQTLTLAVRVGAAVTFSITGSSFNVSGRGGNVPISV
jgi:hypothetical protein